MKKNEEEEKVEGDEWDDDDKDENEIKMMIPLKFENDNEVYTHSDAAAEFHQIQNYRNAPSCSVIEIEKKHMESLIVPSTVRTVILTRKIIVLTQFIRLKT